VLLGKILSFVKETVVDAARISTSKEGFKNLYQVILYRNAIYLMINSAALALTGFFFWIVAARLYPTEGVGLASAVIASSGFLASLSTLGFDYGLIRFLPVSGEKARAMINSCFTVAGLISIALALIFLAGLGIWSPALLLIRENMIFFAAFIFFTIAFTLGTFANQAFIAERRAGFSLAQGLIFALLRFIPLFVLAPLFYTFGIFASLGIAASVAVAVGILLFLPRIQKGYRPSLLIDKRVLNQIAHFSFANYAANIFSLLPQVILPLMVVNLLGAEQNAYFYVGWNVASTLLLIPRATSLSLFAEGSYDDRKIDYEIRRSLKLILVLLVPAIIILLLLGDKILLLFGGVYSANATKLLWILAFSAFPFSLNYIYYGLKMVERRMKSVIGLTIFTATATLGISYLLLPRMGILGGGIAWLSSQGVVALIVMYNLGRRWRATFTS
jgi:O-antigen/teichoic acid export membrane protein